MGMCKSTQQRAKGNAPPDQSLGAIRTGPGRCGDDADEPATLVGTCRLTILLDMPLPLPSTQRRVCHLHTLLPPTPHASLWQQLSGKTLVCLRCFRPLVCPAPFPVNSPFTTSAAPLYPSLSRRLCERQAIAFIFRTSHLHPALVHLSANSANSCRR